MVAGAVFKAGAKMAGKRGASMAAKRGASMAAKRGASSMARRATVGGPMAMMERAQQAQNMYGQAQQMRGMMGGGATVPPMNMGSQIPMAQPAQIPMAPTGAGAKYAGRGMAQATGGNTVFYVAGGILACLVLMGSVMFVRNKNKKDSEFDI